MAASTVGGGAATAKVSSARAVDVYDIATDIGHEFEAIIDAFGADALTNLVPKVIDALEQLERLTLRCEQEAAAGHELRRQLDRLHAEKAERAGEKQRFEKELEEFEERTRAETERLVATVTDIQTENTRLRHLCALSDNGKPHTGTDSPDGDGSRGDGDVDLKAIHSLKTVIDRQKDELQAKDALVHDKTQQLEQAHADLERCRKQTRELRRRHRLQNYLQKQLAEERTSLEMDLTENRRQMSALRHQLGAAHKENMDLSQSVEDTRHNKVVFDRDDPTRPRFTFNELRDILNERNEMKARVSDLQDELCLYKPGGLDMSKTSMLCPPTNDDLDSFSSSDLSSPPSLQYELDRQNRSSVADEDLPVHGPLPMDPDDAPWKRHESGIRRLFRRVFGTGSPQKTYNYRRASTPLAPPISCSSAPPSLKPL